MTEQRAIESRWLTWANALTLLRLAAAPACACAIVSNARFATAALFALAIATDLADGRVARRRGESSAFGGLLDHATDATFVAVGLAAWAWRGEVPALLPVVIAVAFVQYALDSRALAGQPLRTSALGRWNGIAYFVLLGTPIVRDALALGWPPVGLVRVLGWALAATTLASIADRALALQRTRAGRP